MFSRYRCCLLYTSFLEMYLEHEIHVPAVIAIKINIVIISIKIFMAAPVIKSFYVML